jgi:hypothetical protein
MKNLLVIVCFFFAGTQAFGQLSKKMAQDTLIWTSDYFLSKEDFKAKRSAYGNKVPAYVTTAIYIYQKENNGQLMFYVEGILLKSKSFMKEETPYTLRHEQLHFDICELYARKLRQKISQKDFTKVRDLVGEIQKIYDKTSADWHKEEEKYDNDTQHGINAAKQQLWNDTIAKQLQDLEAFASIAVDIVKK